MTVNPLHDADVVLPFLEKMIGIAAGLQDAHSESLDVAREALKLRTIFESDADAHLGQRIHSYIGGNFGRDPDDYELDELIRLSYYDSAKGLISRRFRVRSAALWDELLRVGVIRHYKCPDGDDCPVCSRRERSLQVTIDDLLAVAEGLAADPFHRLLSVNPDKVHAATVHWLATVGGVDRIWSDVGLRGPLPPPDAPRSELGTHGTHLILDDGQGHWKAVVQCCFSKRPDADHVAKLRDRSVKASRLGNPGYVKWNLYSLGVPTFDPNPSWQYLTIDHVEAAIDDGPAADDPAAQAYSRYLGKLVTVRDCVLALGENDEFHFPATLGEELKELGVRTTCELSLDLGREPR